MEETAKMKKVLAITLVCLLTLTALTACGSGDTQSSGQGTESSPANSPASSPADSPSNSTAISPSSPPAAESPQGTTNDSNFDLNHFINVVRREAASGTHGAFIELFGILHDGVDRTTPEAQTADGTNLVLTTVAGDTYAIGYVSMGALNPTVKALSVDGVAPSVDNINNGTYGVMRPFNIAYKDLSNVAQDFYDFIFSAEGQAVVLDRGYITVDDTGPFSSTQPSGTVTVSGSTSVEPLMARLIQAYEEINPNARIDLQGGGSSAGMRDAIGDISDIGMASRDLSADEISQLNHRAICIDGIAIIANLDNPLTNIISDDVTDIYIGEITAWSEIQ